MSCRCASITDEFHGWECAVSGGECMFLCPDEKRCYEMYGEGPLAFSDEIENQKEKSK